MGRPFRTSKFMVSRALFGISRLLEVDVGVSEGPPGDHVSADTDGEDGSGRGELLEQHGLGDLGSQVTNIEAGHGIVGARLLGRGSSLHCHFYFTCLSQNLM